ncbi:MAG: sulfatase [Acidobacteriia bacterium]|nr:sulfatase [Terriglobia bacterium]
MIHGSLSRRQLLASSFGASLGAPLLRAQAARPNVIFLLTDDHRWDALGCMGNRMIQTPHIDRLSEKGVTFDNCFVTTSICMTSRASIFTGLYARAHSIHDFAKPFTEDQLAATYPALMQASGYHTGFIGKYGVGNRMPESRFNYWRGFPGQGKYFPDNSSKHLTEIMGDQALEFMDTAPTGKPFQLSISFKAGHVQDEDPRQFLPSPATEGLYRNVKFPVPKTAHPRYISQLPFEVQRSENRRRWAVRFATPELYQESVRNYYRLITEVDTVVGRIRDQLKKMNQDQNTVIVFNGDNGFYLGEHGLAGKWLMHEESIRVPLVVYDPRFPASAQGVRRKEMVLNIDLAPTLLQTAGLPAAAGMQGRSLYPLLGAGKRGWRKDWFYEHKLANEWIPPTEGVRTERWKYTRYMKTTPQFEELFDLDKDGLEERNLAREAAHQAQLEQMRGRWRTWNDNLNSWRPHSVWTEPL